MQYQAGCHPEGAQRPRDLAGWSRERAGKIPRCARDDRGLAPLLLPVAWAYVATRDRRKVDKSLVTTISLLPIAVAAIMVIVRDSLAVAFSLAGIAGLVRFRNALDDARDAMYVILAIAVGLGAGVGALEAAAALSVRFNLVAVIL